MKVVVLKFTLIFLLLCELVKMIMMMMCCIEMEVASGTSKSLNTLYACTLRSSPKCPL